MKFKNKKQKGVVARETRKSLKKDLLAYSSFLLLYDLFPLKSWDYYPPSVGDKRKSIKPAFHGENNGFNAVIP